MKTMNYAQAKAELSKQCSNIKYFNRAFFKAFDKAIKKAQENKEKGIEDCYIIDGVYYFHSFDEIYASKFYQKNSCAYCEFLSISYGYELV